MATRKKQSQQEQLVELLRAKGLRKRVAETFAEAAGRAPSRKPPQAVMKALSDLRSLPGEIESRLTGGPDKKRSEAAKKAAATRKRAAAKRSASAKKAAQTRAKKSTSSSGTRSRSRAKAGSR